MAAPPWDAGLQHGGRHQQLAQVHGPLVPHVRQDLHLHQQVEGYVLSTTLKLSTLPVQSTLYYTMLSQQNSVGPSAAPLTALPPAMTP